MRIYTMDLPGGVLVGLLWLLVGSAVAVERRDNSLLSSLVRHVVQRSDYNQGDQEYSRVTQAPLVKVHLHKVFLPSSLHESLKSDLGEQLLEREELYNPNMFHIPSGANDVESANSREEKELAAVIESLDELETLSGTPLQRINSHNYSEREFKTVFPVSSGVRKPYSNIVENPIGLSDYAVISPTPVSNGPGEYVVLERRKLKPSELEMEDTERAHMPIFVERGDQPINAA